MTRREGRKQWAGELPLEVIEAMREADEPMWKIVTSAVRMYLGLDENSTEHALNRRIDELEEEIDTLEETIEQKQSERDQKVEMRDELVEKRDEIREKKESHRERLDTILDEMVSQPEKQVIAWMGELKEAAKEEYGDTTSNNIDRVVGDLRTRRDERCLAIPDHRFRRSGTMHQSAAASADGGDDQPAWKQELLEDDAVEGDD